MNSIRLGHSKKGWCRWSTGASVAGSTSFQPPLDYLILVCGKSCSLMNCKIFSTSMYDSNVWSILILNKNVAVNSKTGSVMSFASIQSSARDVCMYDWTDRSSNTILLQCPSLSRWLSPNWAWTSLPYMLFNCRPSVTNSGKLDYMLASLLTPFVSYMLESAVLFDAYRMQYYTLAEFRSTEFW